MSKKLAEGLNRLVLDVKWGSGAFMKTQEEAHRLAHSLVTVGEAMGVRSSVRLSEMNEPTGESAGNALEVAECVRCLKGEGPQDLEDIVLDLASAVSVSSRADLAAMLHRGDAWRKFQKMVAAQGGNVDALEKMATVHRAPFIGELKATASGALRRMDAGGIGQAVLELGAGRSKAADPIDYAVGCDQIAKTGTQVQTGDVLLRVHARTKGALFRTLDILTEYIDIV
jgi:thymidine phosphorylase